MIVGIPKEIKQDEFRVSLAPDKVHLLCMNGHRVLVEAGAGLGAGLNDEVYRTAGAEIVEGPTDIFAQADMVVKVKEPQPQEFSLLRESQILFTYLHLAAEKKLTETLLQRKVTGVAYETVQLDDHSLPLLYPMSEIAGRLAPQIAAHLLQKNAGGVGKLIGGIPGVRPCNVVIIGGGTVGTNAVTSATGLGAKVTVLDIDLIRLRYLSYHFGYIETHMSTPFNVANNLLRADVVIGAVLIAGAVAPTVVTKDMVKQMLPNSVIIDVAVDQGGCIETIHPTTHSEPTYKVDGVIHYAVPNMPGTVPYTSSISLSNATYTYVLKLANQGLKKALLGDPALAKGINTYQGHVTHPAVADAFDKEYAPIEKLL